MLRLRCEVKKYDWGQRGGNSLVADLAANGDAKLEIDPEAAYAELWMGAHVSGPSLTAHSGEPLTSWLSRNPSSLGKEVLLKYGVNLPFLFKVLSIQKSLSIQSHPDKKLAERLHAERPNIYKDPNHKPEIALAVKGFEALCGFSLIDDINSQLLDKPELLRCVGGQQAHEVKNSVGTPVECQRRALKEAFKSLMTCSETVYGDASQALYERLLKQTGGVRHEKDSLFIRVFDQYPRDVGTLAVFFLNYVRLEPGEAVYLAANEPHAYLSGELIEAMANSDNVIRVGLTPKLRDTEVLCESLTYNQEKPKTLRGHKVTDCILKYQPPFEEFQVLSVSVDKEGTVAIPAQRSPMLLMCLSCNGSHSLVTKSCGLSIVDDSLQNMVSVQKGTVLFIPAHTEMMLHSINGDHGCSLLAYAATANDYMFQTCAREDNLLAPNSMAQTSDSFEEVQLQHANAADK
eukprot:jgi/Ulvmu1/12002/UM083_0015.1